MEASGLRIVDCMKVVTGLILRLFDGLIDGHKVSFRADLLQLTASIAARWVPIRAVCSSELGCSADQCGIFSHRVIAFSFR